MQFSDSDSSGSSAAPMPAKRLQKAAPPQQVSGGLDSTVRAFTATVSPDSREKKKGSGIQSSSDDDIDDGAVQCNSSLRINITAGTQGSPMTTATRVRAFIPKSDDDDDSATRGNGQNRSVGCVPSSQKAPPFFSQSAAEGAVAPHPATTATVPATTTAAAPVVRAAVKTFRLGQTYSFSSSSTSSLSLELPGMKRAVPAKGTGSAQQQQQSAQSRSALLHSTASSSSVVSSRESSPAVERRQDVLRSSSSSSASSTSDVVFHRLAVPQSAAGTTSTEAAAKMARKASASQLALHKDPCAVEAVLVAPVTATASAAASPRSIVESVTTFQDAAGTLADTSRTTALLETSAAGNSLTTATVLPDREACLGPSTASPRNVSAAQAAVNASPVSEASLTATTSEKGASPRRQIAQPATNAAQTSKNAVVSDFDDEVLDSSAASFAAQAALDAAEQQAQAETSPLASATAPQSLSVTASQGVLPLVPPQTRMPPGGEAEEELTIEQQNAPATHGTFTYATSVEAAQAAVGGSASLLPPTRSSSSSSSSSNSNSSVSGSNIPSHKGTTGRNAGAHRSHAGNSNSSNASSNGGTTFLSPPHKTLERSGTLEEDEGGTLRSNPTMGGATVTSAANGGFLSRIELKHQQLLQISSIHGGTHGETQTAALATTTTTTTGDESLSRLSGVLMPPSPSQPRVSLSPHATSSINSSKASSAKGQLRGGQSGAVPLPAPTPPSSDEDEEKVREDEKERAAPAIPTGMRMAPAPSSSSSSSSSSSASSDDAASGVPRRVGADRLSGKRPQNSDKDDTSDADDNDTDKGVVAEGSGLRIRTMPRVSSDRDDDEDDDSESESEDDLRKRKTEPKASAEQLVQSSSNTGGGSSRSPSSSSAVSASQVESKSAQMKKALRAYKFCGSSPSDTDTAERNEKWSEGQAEEGKKEEEEEGEWHNDEDEEDAAAAVESDGKAVNNPNELQESGRWDEVLKGMELIDCTLLSRVYQQMIPRYMRASYSDADEGEEEAGEDVCLFKVLSPFPVVASDERARWSRRTEVQQRLLDLAQTMRDTQQALEVAGLTAAGVERSLSAARGDGGDGDDGGRAPTTRLTRTTCSGIIAVYVDANCRLIAQLEAEPYMVPLRHLLPAVCSAGLQEVEVLALIRSVVCKAATMHNAGFVHGALHPGNVLLSSYDGDVVLTQPCGLMSQSSLLPSDLSVLSVSRACAMAAHLPRVWGTQQLHVVAPTSTRLGTPPRPELEELITYHNLAALGWDAEENGDARDTVYTPTTADDLYALGMMAFLLYLGVPPFHMVSLWAAVERLGVLAGDYEAAVASPSSSSSRQEARRHIAEFCFGRPRRCPDDDVALPELFTCGYASLQRHVAGRYRPEFEKALQSFIVDCVEASCVAAVAENVAVADGGSDEKKRHHHHIEDSSCGPHYRTAQDLLDAHPLFQRAAFDSAVTKSSKAGEEDSVEEQMRDTVHRVAYPALCTWSRASKECGSAPHLARMHSNALYTARIAALCESLVAEKEQPPSEQSTEAEAAAAPTLLSALCPEVAGDMHAWQPAFPSVETHVSADGCDCGCVYSAVREVEGGKGGAESKAGDPSTSQHLSRAQARRRSAVASVAAWDDVSSLVRPSDVAAPSWLTDRDDHDEDTVADDDTLAEQLLLRSSASPMCEFSHYPNLHALVLTDKKSSSYALSRAFVLSQVSCVADTLVLQHLQDCTVTLLAPFRYVVLDDVVRCEIRLGPCEVCVLRDVQDCPLVAVAAHFVAGTRVQDTQLSWSGQGGRQNSQLTESRGVTFSLYGLVYSGLVEDYTRVGLPLEHVASLRTRGEGQDDESASQQDTASWSRSGCSATGVRERVFELLATTANVRTQNEIGLCLTPEAPYAHALLAMDSRFVHRGSRAVVPADAAGREQELLDHPEPEKDVFYYYGELGEKDVLICDVHGSKEGETVDGVVSRPVVFVHDVLGDVTIEDCSFCTIAVVGTPSSLQVIDCHHCQLIAMAREAVVERCTRMDCLALVTEYLLVHACKGLRVRPLFLDCPYSDEVLRQVVMGSLGGQEEETVIAAYEAGRLDLLNAVLRGVGQGVNVEESVDVVIEDMHFYCQKSNSDNSGSAPGEAEQGGGGGDGGEKWFSVFTVPYTAISCSAQREGGEAEVSEASEVMAEAAQALAEHLSLPVFTELLQRYEDATDTTPAAEQRHATHPVLFHNLLDCSVLRLRGALCPVRTAAQVSAEAAGEDPAAVNVGLSDVCVDCVHGGALYIEDVVGTLQLRHCVGPLDVVACAATTVVMEHCVGVQLRTACVDFRATDCTGCHVALHVNNRPQYRRCASMETSVLNITAGDFDAMLAAAGVGVAENQFDAPLLLNEAWRPTETVATPVASLAAAEIHAYCSGDTAATPDSQSASTLYATLLSILNTSDEDGKVLCVPPDQMPLVMALLRQPVTVVAPLPGLCVSPRPAAFLAELEPLVSRWSRPRVLAASRANMVAAALRALADVSHVYLEVPNWGPAVHDAAAVTDAHEVEDYQAEQQLPKEEGTEDKVGEAGDEEENGEVFSPVLEAAKAGKAAPHVAASALTAEVSAEVAPAAFEAHAEVEDSAEEQVHESSEDEGKAPEPTATASAAVVEEVPESGDDNDDEDNKPQLRQQSHVAVAAIGAMQGGVFVAEAEEMEVMMMLDQEVMKEVAAVEEVWGEAVGESEVVFAAVAAPVPSARQEVEVEEVKDVEDVDALHRDTTVPESAASNSAAVVSPLSPLTERHEDGAPAEVVEDVTPITADAVAGPAACVARVGQDPVATLSGAAHATGWSSGSTLTSSSGAGRTSEPLLSQSPLATLLEPSAMARTPTGDDGDNVNATTATIAAPIIGASVGSSVGLPPMAPGPAYALAATDVGASAAMDVFNRTYRSAVMSTDVGRLDESDIAPLQAAVVEDRPVHVDDSLNDLRPTLTDASWASATVFPAAHDNGARHGGVVERLQLEAAPLMATINSFQRDSEEGEREEEEEEWAHMPQVDTPHSAKDASLARQPTVNGATTAVETATRATTAAQFITSASAPVLAVQEGAEDVVEFSPQASSSVSDYPHRGVPAREDSAARGTEVEGNEARRADATLQTTNFLHFSQDSSSRRGEYSLPPSHLAVNGTSPPVSPGEHRTLGSGSFAAPLMSLSEVATVPGVGAGVRELLRQVEEARRRFERRQQQLHSETLEVRVRAAVAKLKAMKAQAEVT